MVKNFIELIKSKFFWYNILGAFGGLILLGFIVLFILKIYTNHGESIKVPNMIGMYENEAEILMKKAGLKLEIIDSVYLRDQKGGVIVEQTPKSGSNVKGDRIVFLTINAKTKKDVAVPNLLNLSQRQATYTINSLGFKVGGVTIVPSEYADMVIDIKYNGTSLKAGDKIPDGSTISLIVGKNDSTYSGKMIIVPSLVGISSAQAEDIIVSNNLVVGYVGFDNPQPSNDSEKQAYRIYKQIPQPEESVIPGKRIDIWLTKDPKKLQGSKNQKEDDFF